MVVWFGYILLGISLVLSLWPEAQRPELQRLGDCRPPGFEVTRGTLDAADHEAEEGYYVIGNVTLLAEPRGISALQLRELKGRRGVLVFVPEEAK